MAKPKIFVSHSTLDTVFTTKLVNDLNASGAQAWMDTNDLGAGNFQQRISEALADCEWFLLVLTRNALASDWVRQEVDAANRLKHQQRIKELIFIKAAAVENAELPALWGVFNIFDATVDYTLALDRTLKALGIVAPKAPASTPRAIATPKAEMPSIMPVASSHAEGGYESLMAPTPLGKFADSSHTSVICPECGETSPFRRNPKLTFVQYMRCGNCGKPFMVNVLEPKR